MHDLQKAISKFVMETVQGQICQPQQNAAQAKQGKNQQRATQSSVETPPRTPPKTPPKRSRLRKLAKERQDAEQQQPKRQVPTSVFSSEPRQVGLKAFNSGEKSTSDEFDDEPPCYECGEYEHRARDHPGAWTERGESTGKRTERRGMPSKACASWGCNSQR
jgi:hypothetical protein|mmetsp:Transcript_41774/g.70532  ORF Transcript_41774/g.70532 Transcript_41774/m.70532 type:complete len:162 (-) Transcript_41774:3194-3679(-)